MEKYIFYIGLLVFIMSLENISGQTKTTKETKVIAVVNDTKIMALALFENSENQREVLLKKYPKSKFYIGILKGRYELKDGVVVLKSDATITLYTEKQIFNAGKLFKDKKLKQGEAISIGNAKAKVVAAKKGELIIKTNN